MNAREEAEQHQRRPRQRARRARRSAGTANASTNSPAVTSEMLTSAPPADQRTLANVIVKTAAKSRTSTTRVAVALDACAGTLGGRQRDAHPRRPLRAAPRAPPLAPGGRAARGSPASSGVPSRLPGSPAPLELGDRRDHPVHVVGSDDEPCADLADQRRRLRRPAAPLRGSGARRRDTRTPCR